MSDPCPTLDSLIALGFDNREPQFGMETVGYRFVHLDLVASHGMNMYARYVVRLSGVVNTGRTLGTVDSQMPPDLGSASAAAAWVSYALQSYRSELEPLPDWFVEGERSWDLIPFVAEQRAYQARPKCFIDRDYARPIRRNLLEEMSRLAGETKMTFSFDGRVLSIVLCGRLHEVIASGDSWQSSYQVIVSPETTLPARFMDSMVEVSVFEDYLRLDGHRLGLCEAIT